MWLLVQAHHRVVVADLAGKQDVKGLLSLVVSNCLFGLIIVIIVVVDFEIIVVVGDDGDVVQPEVIVEFEIDVVVVIVVGLVILVVENDLVFVFEIVLGHRGGLLKKAAGGAVTRRCSGSAAWAQSCNRFVHVPIPAPAPTATATANGPGGVPPGPCRC